MNDFKEILKNIENEEHKNRLEELLNWVIAKYPTLKPEIKWNQPMFSNEGTFIIGFSVSKQHIAVAPEQAGIKKFIEEIEEVGYDHTHEIIRIKWKQKIDYELLDKIINYKIQDKAGYTTFWR